MQYGYFGFTFLFNLRIIFCKSEGKGLLNSKEFAASISSSSDWVKVSFQTGSSVFNMNEWAGLS